MSTAGNGDPRAALSVLAAAGEAPDAAALVDGDDVLTYRTLAAAVRVRMAGLVYAGVGASSASTGDRLALLGRPDRTTVVSLLAAMELGVPVALLHPRWTDVERARALAIARPRLVLDREHPDAGQAQSVSTSVSDSLAPPGDHTLAIVFTSGSTGEPRAAVLSRRAFLAAADASAAVLGWQRDDAWLCAMPLAHVGGLSIVVRCLAARCAIVLGPTGSFDAHRFAAALERGRATLASVVPTMLARIVEAGLRAPPAVRAVLVGGAACPPRVLAGAAALGWRLRTTYGLTEACAQVATARRDVEGPGDGCGPPLPGVDVEIVDERIRVRSPAAMDGWLRAGAELERPFDARGFYDTGDDGRFDEHGRLHVLGRRTDLLVTGGENVRPAEVEAALEAIPGIRAACVFGIPDERWGAVVAAAIEVDGGKSAPGDDEIARALQGCLAPFKLPRRIVRVPALVTAPSGKLDRAAVRARVLASPSGV